MGWNASALFVEQRTVEQLLDFFSGVTDCVPTDRMVTGDEAMSQNEESVLFVRSTGQWVEAWDPHFSLLPSLPDIIESSGAGTLADTTVLLTFFSSIVSTYGFTLYKGGSLARHVIHADGVIVDADGEPLPVEQEVEEPTWGYDEDYVWAVITAVTQTRIDIDAQYQVVAISP